MVSACVLKISRMTELVDFIVNDIECTVRASKEDAKLLKEDNEYTLKYFTSVIAENKLVDIGLYPTDLNNLTISRKIVQIASPQPQNSTHEVIWSSKGKSSATDIDAVKFMLSIRASEKFSKLFDDKKSVKLQLWSQIGEEMIAAGFNLGPTGLMPEKLRQKFLNLTKIYNNYNHYIKNTTGTEPKSPPEYYEEMHVIMGDKHKSNPKYVMNSLEECNMEKENTEPNNENITDRLSTTENITADTENSNNEINNRFSRISNSCKPKPNKTETVLGKIEEIHNQFIEENKKQFSAIAELINKQNEILEKQSDQKGRLLELFGLAIQNKKSSRKRRRSSSDDSE